MSLPPIPGVESWYSNLLYWALRWADGQNGALQCRKIGKQWRASWTADDGSSVTVRAFDVTTALEALSRQIQDEAEKKLRVAS